MDTGKEGGPMAEESAQGPIQGLTLDQKTVEVLVAQIIPTSKYFESRFDHMQYQVNEIKEDIKQLDARMEKQFTAVRGEISDLEGRMNQRFEQVDAQFVAVRGEISGLEGRMNQRFEQVGKRFEQVDAQFVAVRGEISGLEGRMNQRFEQVDKHFVQVEDKLDKLIERIDRRIDEGLRENRSQMVRLFTFAMTFSAISMIGLIGKMLKLF
jgi:predicted  nucleic acid-binding Zn-ribbon protein